MKSSKAQILSRVHTLPQIRFADVRLTSFAGLVVFQPLLGRLNLKERLRKCFPGGRGFPIYSMHTIMMVLIVHILIGFRRLRDVEYYGDDPMVHRVLGLRRLPSAATLSRALRSACGADYERVRELSRGIVLERLSLLAPARLTLDFDGSVFSTRSHAEGTAVGMNKKRKGARSYYPLFCTAAQTAQFFDVLHRAGNVHDSNGSLPFVYTCVNAARGAAPGVALESRLDSAFFSSNMVNLLDAMRVEFTISVPFERFAELKGLVEGRRRWRRLDDTWSYFETPWKPESWPLQYRFLFVRRKSKVIRKGPVQLELFEPDQYEYEYKVIVTNKTASARKVLRFHNGRGSQEGIFGEAKTHCRIDYIPTRRRAGNQLYMMAAIIAHNLGRELQMSAAQPARGTTEKRTARWAFEHLGTLRRRLIQRAGRLTLPGGRLTLTLSPNPAVRRDLARLLDAMANNDDSTERIAA